MPDLRTIAFARHLPTEEDARLWGLYVVDCGFSEIPPGADYPPIRSPHPGEHSCFGKAGRTLAEYQLVYISEGRGMFDSKPTGRVRVEAGHVIMLFPGVWHRFHPIRRVGWDENWIGFNGEVAERIMNAFFSPDKAVVRVGHDQELKDLIKSVSGVLEDAPPGYQQLMGARTMEALALVRSRSMSLHPLNREAAQKVEQARRHLAKHYSAPVDMTRLAAKLGLSYSRFRDLFKQQTGVAPHQYQLDIRLNLARHWLIDSDLSVTEIAERLGFSSVHYFSRIFKKKTGCPPGAFHKH